MFIDEVIIKVEAGNGGDGCLAFRREKYVSMGGPFGGTGGDGGNIIFKADEGLKTLVDLRFKKLIKGNIGENGEGKNKNGDVVNIFSTNLENMDEFVLGFKDNEELESYFCEMKKNVLEDGQIDYGKFKLFGYSKKDEDIQELPILFGEDFDSLKEELRKDLLKDDDFVRELMILN